MVVMGALRRLEGWGDGCDGGFSKNELYNNNIV